MVCLTPIRIKNAKFNPLDLNEDERPQYLLVPCGKCPICRYNDSISWRIRLMEEFKVSYNCVFVTLTYSDDNLNFAKYTTKIGESVYYPTLSKRDVQNFIKRLRAYFTRELKMSKESFKSFKYFAVGEYGPTTLRPHYHIIFFNFPNYYPRLYIELVKLRKKIEEIWHNGDVTVDNANVNRINYVTKYVFGFTNLPEYIKNKPFRLMSRRPAIGITYLDSNEILRWHREKFTNFYASDQFKYPLPRYYKEKIFDDSEKLVLQSKTKEYLASRDEMMDFFRIKKYHISQSEKQHEMIIDYLHYKFNQFEKKFMKKFEKNREI